MPMARSWATSTSWVRRDCFSKRTPSMLPNATKAWVPTRTPPTRKTPDSARSDSTLTTGALSVAAPPVASMLTRLARRAPSASVPERASLTCSIQASSEGDSLPR